VFAHRVLGRGEREGGIAASARAQQRAAAGQGVERRLVDALESLGLA
jgi:hypothetical protein